MTLCTTLRTVEHVVDDLHKVYCTLVTVTKKLSGLSKEKLVAMATSLERSKPHLTSIIYAHKATNSENFAKIGRVLS